MGRTVALLIGLVVGLVIAGVGVGTLIPQLPVAWRSEGLVWASSATLVVFCVLAAFLVSSPSRR